MATPSSTPSLLPDLPDRGSTGPTERPALPQATRGQRALIDLVAAVAGLGMAAPSYRAAWWPLTFVGLVLLYALLEHAHSRRQALRIGLLAGLGANALIFHFLIFTMVRYGGIPPGIAVVLFVLYLLTLCTRLPLMAWGTWHLRQDGLPLGLAAPLAAVTADMLQISLFPLNLGSTQETHLLFMQCADLVGIKGVTFALSAICGLICSGLLDAPQRRRQLGLALVLLLGVDGYGYVRLRQVEAVEAVSTPLRVGLIQPNTPLRWQRGDLATVQQILSTCSRLTQAASTSLPSGLDLVVWPEGGSPFSYVEPATAGNLAPASSGDTSPPRVGAGMDLRPTKRAVDAYADMLFSNTVRRLSAALRVPVMINEAWYAEADPYNNIRLLDAQGKTTDSYQKMTLLAFGEYVPFAKQLPFLEGLGGVHDHAAGTSLHCVAGPKGPLGVQVCYEILSPRGCRALVNKGALAIINPTNDAWFGPTHASAAHLLEAYPRAIELRRPLVRCTNSGTSTCIAASGRFATPPTGVFIEAWQAAELRCPDITTWYAWWGDGPAWLLVGITLLLGRRSRSPRAAQSKAA